MGSTSKKNPPFSSSDSLNGLKFGQKMYFEDVGIVSTAKLADGSGSPGRVRVPVKKSSGGQAPRCQVEGCKIDLSDAKAYYGRHKVCAVHSKTPKVVVNGLQQRFCQQCSRFHQLPEFDQGKRSCRRRLAGHNERRRKPPPGSLFSAPYGRVSSSVFETGKGGGFLMDFSMYPKLTTSETWPAIIRPPPNPHLTPPMAQIVHSTMPTNPSSTTAFGSLSGTRYHPIGPTIPSGECFTGTHLNSGRALSLLSNQTTMVPHDGSPSPFERPQMVHSTMVHANQFSNEMPCPLGHEDGDGSHEMSCHQMPRNLGLSQGENQYSVESNQLVQYVDLEHSRAFDSSTQFMNWSL